MYPLDLEVLCKKISAVSWDRRQRSMEKGIIPVWRREWVSPYEGLRDREDAHAKNLGGSSSIAAAWGTGSWA